MMAAGGRFLLAGNVFLRVTAGLCLAIHNRLT